MLPEGAMENLPWLGALPEDYVELNTALDELEERDAEKARAVELRFYMGLTSAETTEASVTGIAPSQLTCRIRDSADCGPVNPAARFASPAESSSLGFRAPGPPGSGPGRRLVPTQAEIDESRSPSCSPAASSALPVLMALPGERNRTSPLFESVSPFFLESLLPLYPPPNRTPLAGYSDFEPSRAEFALTTGETT